MIKDNKGYMMPLTIVLLLIFSSAIVHQVSMYESEKRFYLEQEQLFLLQCLQQMAVYDLKNNIQENQLRESGTFFYEKGHVHYMITNENTENIYLNVSVETDMNRQRPFTIAIDKEEMKVVDWKEL